MSARKGFVVSLVSLIGFVLLSACDQTGAVNPGPTASLVTTRPSLSSTSTLVPLNTATPTLSALTPLTNFYLGANFPWYDYGADFGSNAWGTPGVSGRSAVIDADFANMQAKGIRVVRWFVFGDGRSAPRFDANGRVTGFDERFYLDFDTALHLAQSHNIYLLPVLVDSLTWFKKGEINNNVALYGHATVISDTVQRQVFLDKAIRPLFEHYKGNQAILAWEIINEPEWAMAQLDSPNVDQPISNDEMKNFVSEVALYAHRYGDRPVTVGSASSKWLNLWTGIALDFYEIHYYDWMEPWFPLATSPTKLHLDKPLIMGEFPSAGSKISPHDYLQTLAQNGYSGALVWSYHLDNERSRFGNAAPDLSRWSQTQP